MIEWIIISRLFSGINPKVGSMAEGSRYDDENELPAGMDAMPRSHAAGTEQQMTTSSKASARANSTG
jgi:hypothetical protein